MLYRFSLAVLILGVLLCATLSLFSIFLQPSVIYSFPEPSASLISLRIPLPVDAVTNVNATIEDMYLTYGFQSYGIEYGLVSWFSNADPLPVLVLIVNSVLLAVQFVMWTVAIRFHKRSIHSVLFSLHVCSTFAVLLLRIFPNLVPRLKVILVIILFVLSFPASPPSLPRTRSWLS